MLTVNLEVEINGQKLPFVCNDLDVAITWLESLNYEHGERLSAECDCGECDCYE